MSTGNEATAAIAENPLIVTRRDYFAASALTGLLARRPRNIQVAARVSFEIADAMLAARAAKLSAAEPEEGEEEDDLDEVDQANEGAAETTSDDDEGQHEEAQTTAAV